MLEEVDEGEWVLIRRKGEEMRRERESRKTLGGKFPAVKCSNVTIRKVFS